MPDWTRDGTFMARSTENGQSRVLRDSGGSQRHSRDDAPLDIRGSVGIVTVTAVHDGIGWRVQLDGRATLTAGEIETVCQAMRVKAAEVAARNREDA